MDQQSLADQIKPMHNKEMDTAYSKGKSLATLITASEKKENSMLILDMPGHRAVAAAAQPSSAGVVAALPLGSRAWAMPPSEADA